MVDPQFYSLVENSPECDIMIDVGILREEYDCLIAMTIDEDAFFLKYDSIYILFVSD